MAHLTEGFELGPLKIIRLLGSGGMADVYEAEDTRLGRHVAVKVLPEEYSRNADFIMRFEREVKASAALSHTNIVTVFEFGTVDNLNYYTMRLLPGGDLRAKIADGMSIVDILKTLRGVLQAFLHAHSRGFVHRDVKPENIMFDDQDTPTLTDFGIAKALDSHTRMTQTGMAVGTPRYISPEQAMGKDVDGRSDLYSLGCILYEMLMGQVPFKAETPIATIFQHVNEPIPRLSEEFAAFQELQDLLMAKAPEDRIQDAKSALEYLDKAFPSDWTGTFDTSRITSAHSAPGSVTPAPTPIRTQATERPEETVVRQAADPALGDAATVVSPVAAPGEQETQLLQATPTVDAQPKAGSRKAKQKSRKSAAPATREKKSGSKVGLFLIVVGGLVVGGGLWSLFSTDGKSTVVPKPTVVSSPTGRPTERVLPSRTPRPTTTRATPTARPTARPTATPVPATPPPTELEPTATPAPTKKATPIPTTTTTPRAQPSVTATPRPTAKPTATPTKRPTKQPTRRPTRRPTATPTPAPTRAPTRRPTALPPATRQPTRAPTREPVPSPVIRSTPTPEPCPTPTPTPTKKPNKVQGGFF